MDELRGVSPNPVPLVAAVLAEQHYKLLVSRRYFNRESLGTLIVEVAAELEPMLLKAS